MFSPGLGCLAGGAGRFGCGLYQSSSRMPRSYDRQ